MYYAQRKKQRMAAGLCTCCGKVAPMEGHRLCEKCLKTKKESVLKPEYAEATARYRATEEYKQKMKAYSLERRRRLTAEGLCYICGKRPVAPGKRGCEECRARISEKRRLKKEEGLCLNCGKKHEGGTTYCFECRVKMSEAERRKNGGE